MAQDSKQLELHGCLTPACPVPGSEPKVHRGLRVIILLRAHLPSSQILPQQWREETGRSLLQGAVRGEHPECCLELSGAEAALGAQHFPVSQWSPVGWSGQQSTRALQRHQYFLERSSP